MDWIKARLGCSSDHAWITLREQLRSDVTHWKELEPQQANNIEFNSDDQSFTISTRSASHKQWARIQHTGFTIDVHLNGDRKYTLAPTLNTKGECRLRHNGNEVEFWQASRLILEPILFGEDMP